MIVWYDSRVCACMHACVRACVCVRVCVYVCIHNCILFCGYMHWCMYVRVHAGMHVCVCVCVCIHANVLFLVLFCCWHNCNVLNNLWPMWFYCFYPLLPPVPFPMGATQLHHIVPCCTVPCPREQLSFAPVHRTGPWSQRGRVSWLVTPTQDAAPADDAG